MCSMDGSIWGTQQLFSNSLDYIEVVCGQSQFKFANKITRGFSIWRIAVVNLQTTKGKLKPGQQYKLDNINSGDDYWLIQEKTD